MRKGLTEAQVEAALGDLADADLPPKTVAALRLVDLITTNPPAVDAAAFAALREHLSNREILEYGVAVSVAHGWQRFIEAFGIRPDFWSDTTPLLAEESS